MMNIKNKYIAFIGNNEYSRKIQEILKKDFSNDSLTFISFTEIILIKFNDLLNNSLDSNSSTIKTSLKYNTDKKEFTFFIRDNWGWINSAKTEEKKNNPKKYIWWEWNWLDNLEILTNWKIKKFIWEKWAIFRAKVSINDLIIYERLILENKAENSNTYNPQFFAKMDLMSKK